MADNITPFASRGMGAKSLGYLRLYIILLLIFGCALTVEAKRPLELNIGRGEAYVNHLEGTAQLLRKADGATLPLRVGEILRTGDEITVGSGKSRLEVVLSDRSLVRFADNTRLRIAQLEPDKDGSRINVDINMMVGRSFANISRAVGKTNFNMTSENAVAGVRGTVYRMNVEQDKSVLVRVYEGQVQVSGGVKALETPRVVGPPERIAGPQPIPGPTRVSMEEWVYIVREMQQIRIRSDGSSEVPVSFTKQEDLDEWVIWNRERDKLTD
ncbi:MAG: FecR family protein [Smithellaceae bacterium]|nr:FecR family protein [Smithellaceae bacterium]